MIGRVRAAACAVVTALACAFGTAAGQTVTINFSGTVNDSISPAPVITITADQVPADLQPASITFVASFENQFRAPFYVRSAAGVVAQFQVDSLLPQRTKVYFRAQILDRNGVVRAQQVVAETVQDWLALVSPARAPSNVVFSQQPTFSWSSPAITLPPGPWVYELDVVNTATNIIAESLSVNTTTIVSPTVLDACTSYKWSVTARAVNGGANDVITVKSPGTFVIQSAACPTATNFYNNFPNPFGRGTLSAKTCFWFDLAHRSSVKLTVLDARLREVRRIVPGLVLDSAAYGRQTGAEQSGGNCQYAWDGRDDQGRQVPPGLYYAVFEADGKRDTRKMLYKGP